jgi:hypothetical protein
LQAEAWAAYPKGVIPRTTTGGILHGSLAALADELGVDRITIHKDLRTINQEDLRREEIAPRLPGLREEAGVGRRSRLPKDAVWRLSREFGVTPWVIRKDIDVIDRSTPYTRPPAPPRQPWDTWARLRRPRPQRFTRQLSTLFPEEVYEKLVATGHPASVIRQAVEAWLSTGTHHSPDDCAMTVVQSCDLSTQGMLLRSSMRLERPLVEVLTALLLVGSKKEA